MKYSINLRNFNYPALNASIWASLKINNAFLIAIMKGNFTLVFYLLS